MTIPKCKVRWEFFILFICFYCGGHIHAWLRFGVLLIKQEGEKSYWGQLVILVTAKPFCFSHMPWIFSSVCYGTYWPLDVVSCLSKSGLSEKHSDSEWWTLTLGLHRTRFKSWFYHLHLLCKALNSMSLDLPFLLCQMRHHNSRWLLIA